VICDEFQDTGDDQWHLVQRLGQNGRLLLLADPDQMIHDWRADVRPERLEEARHLAGVAIALEEKSHRDKSGSVPALAKAVLKRHFADPAVTTALAKGVLRVVKDVDPVQLAETVATEVRQLRRSGCATVGVFGFTNDGSAALAAQLTGLGLGNTIVGIPESHGEGLAAIGVLVAHAVGEATLMDVRFALATFLTAATRGKAPPLALTLIAPADLPAQLDELLRNLSARLTIAAKGSIGDVLQVVRDAWSSIFTGGGGSRLWIRAFGTFAGFADGIVSARATSDAARTLLDRAERFRATSLASDLDETRGVSVQLMNFHQTKGREADAVVLVFRRGDIYASWQEDREPYTRPSRLLYVAISRARHKVTVILPPTPHALVAPFRNLAD
jgi:DNA helicase-2/ATP-dependent DNA helicase PcrA